MDRSPSSGPTRMMITNSTRYGLTTGSYAAEWFELTPAGKLVTSPETQPAERLKAQFSLAIEAIEPFKYLYEQYKGKKLPSQEVMKDVLRESKLAIEDEQECIDTFIVNAKYLGLLKTIAGAETLVPVAHILDAEHRFSRAYATADRSAAPTRTRGKESLGKSLLLYSADWRGGFRNPEALRLVSRLARGTSPEGFRSGGDSGRQN
jgi:hypothetical protein